MMSITLFFSELKMIVNKRDTTEYVFPERDPPLLAIIRAPSKNADKLSLYTFVAVIYLSTFLRVLPFPHQILLCSALFLHYRNVQFLICRPIQATC